MIITIVLLISVSKAKTPRKRATRLSAVQMLEAKYQRKADLNEQRAQTKDAGV